MFALILCVKTNRLLACGGESSSFFVFVSEVFKTQFYPLKHNSILYNILKIVRVNAHEVQSKKKTYHVKSQRQPHDKLQPYRITNDDSCEKLIGTFEKIKADGIEMIKKFTKGVAILTTAGVLYDSASKIKRLSKFKTIRSEDYK